ncbi:hypothetical protein ACFWIQ_19710 [Kitasatospora sp. NPDC127059]|uniref:hypothetical protein n=1 Tax=unclassified Kitasatospora TaxID=2633591 RepID=UPI00365B9697
MSPGPRRPAPRAAAAALRATVLGLTGACALLAVGAAPAVAGGSLVTVIDNSNADSWLEIDRTANVQQGGGSAGSDHDGAGSLVGGLGGGLANGLAGGGGPP